MKDKMETITEKTVDQKLVKDVIDAMKKHNAVEYSEKSNTFILDMNKGFLFFNHAKGWIYRGFSMVQNPSYLSSEAQRMSSIVNYTIGFKDGVYTVHKKRSVEDFNKLLDEIIKE